MEFITDAQKVFYESHKDITDKGADYQALIFTLGIDSTCRDHFDDIYDVNTGNIKPEAIKAAWQTTGSRKVTRLAINLFTYNVPNEDDAALYTPKELLSGIDETHKQGMIYALIYFA